MATIEDEQVIELLALYLADCQEEHLEYNDDTYEKAIELAKMLNMPEADYPKP